MGLSCFDLVTRVLFPCPEPSYGPDDFKDELIWIPKTLDPLQAGPEDFVPCLLMQSPSARFTILFCHSNAEDLGRCYSFCRMLRSQFQVNVLAVEYPGYGICPGGQASEESVTENAFVAFRFLHEVLGWPLDGIILMGRSIGCGPTLSLAEVHQVYGVIIVCPFLSVRELCRHVMGSLAQFIQERFPNRERVAKMRSPLLVVHGKQDQVVPWEHGEQLFKCCRSRRRLVAPETMEHNSSLQQDPTFFVLPVLQFFALPDYCFDELHVPQWAYEKRGRLGVPRSLCVAGCGMVGQADLINRRTKAKALPGRSKTSKAPSRDRSPEQVDVCKAVEAHASMAFQRYLKSTGIANLESYIPAARRCSARPMQPLSPSGSLSSLSSGPADEFSKADSDAPPAEKGFRKVPRTLPTAHVLQELNAIPDSERPGRPRPRPGRTWQASSQPAESEGSCHWRALRVNDMLCSL